MIDDPEPTPYELFIAALALLIAHGVGCLARLGFLALAVIVVVLAARAMGVHF